MTGSILSYQQTDSIRLLCEIDLKKLFPAPASKERNRFDINWNGFLESDQCNKEIFERKGDRLKYQSEHLIPSKSNNSLPLLLVLGNPASHSVKAGMFFGVLSASKCKSKKLFSNGSQRCLLSFSAFQSGKQLKIANLRE